MKDIFRKVLRIWKKAVHFINILQCEKYIFLKVLKMRLWFVIKFLISLHFPNSSKKQLIKKTFSGKGILVAKKSNIYIVRTRPSLHKLTVLNHIHFARGRHDKKQWKTIEWEKTSIIYAQAISSICFSRLDCFVAELLILTPRYSHSGGGALSGER